MELDHQPNNIHHPHEYSIEFLHHKNELGTNHCEGVDDTLRLLAILVYTNRHYDSDSFPIEVNK
jgi:hypothetical protein